MPGPVRDETRSGSLNFNDVIQPLAVDQLPFSGVGESGCKSAHSHNSSHHHATCGSARGTMKQALTTTSPDGHQTLKYSYDEYTYLRSSVDIPLA
jgi:acyl-CoA reductase-like NAD-dependent aldehyde dehydrogenase